MGHTALYKENFFYNRAPFDPSADTIQFFAWFDSIWKPGFIASGKYPEHVIYTFITEGSYKIYRGDSISILKEGDFSIGSRPYKKAEVTSNVPCRRKSFMVYKDSLHEMIISRMFKKEAVTFHFVNKEKILIIMNLIREEMSGGQDNAVLAGLYFRLLHELYSQYHKNILPESLEKALVFINANLHDSKLSRASIAEAGGVSIRTLCRIFKQHLHTQPAAYIIKLRMEHIRNLLAMPNLSIKEIAWKTGFTSQNFMGRMFKKKYKISPSEYRNSLRGR